MNARRNAQRPDMFRALCSRRMICGGTDWGRNRRGRRVGPPRRAVRHSLSGLPSGVPLVERTRGPGDGGGSAWVSGPGWGWRCMKAA